MTKWTACAVIGAALLVVPVFSFALSSSHGITASDLKSVKSIDDLKALLDKNATKRNDIQPAPSSAPVPGQYIVVLKNADLPKLGVHQNKGTAKDVKTHAKDFIAGGNKEKHTYHAQQLYSNVLDGFSAHLTDAEVADLKNDPAVDYVVPDKVVTVFSGGTQASSTGYMRIGANGLSNKGAGIEVAIIDTGIDTTHPDLAANIMGGYSCVPGEATSTYQDGFGHGTHVAGIVAALDNTIGVVGIAPQAKLWAVRVLGNNGSGWNSDVICGLDFVTAHAPANGGNITVANMSFGGSGTSDNNCGVTDHDPLHASICRARDAGVTLVAAAGNNAGSASQITPAAYDDAVITVSALQDLDGAPGGANYDPRAGFSNYGSVVDLGAPGLNINSTVPTGSCTLCDVSGYRELLGTSMAAPHVAGAAALYIAQHPSASWSQVRDALVASGEPAGYGHEGYSGVALLNSIIRNAFPEPVLLVGTDPLPGPTLVVSDDAANPFPRLATAGTSNAIVGAYSFYAKGSSIRLDKVHLVLDGSTASTTDIGTVSLWNGSTQVGSATFSNNQFATTSVLSSPVTIPANKNVVLTLKSNLAAQGTGQAGTRGNIIALRADVSSGETTGTVVSSSANIVAIGTTTSNSVRAFKSVPTLLKQLPVPYPGMLASSGTDGALLRFSITADSAGSISIKSIPVTILQSSGMVATNIRLLGYTDSGFSSPVSGQRAGGQIGTSTNEQVIIVDLPALAIFVADQPLVIPAGQTDYFEVRATNTYSGTGILDTLIFLGDPLVITMDPSAPALSDGCCEPVWSPNTFGDSQYTDKDWTNGYAIPISSTQPAQFSEPLSSLEIHDYVMHVTNDSLAQIGTTTAISWTTTDAPVGSSVMLMLANATSGVDQLILTNNTVPFRDPNDTFIWSIPNTVTSGNYKFHTYLVPSNYCLAGYTATTCASTTTNELIGIGTSPQITLVSGPSMHVTVPPALATGSDVAISWETDIPPSGSHVVLWLDSATGTDMTALNGTLAQMPFDSYTWHVPSNQTVGDYKFRVYLVPSNYCLAGVTASSCAGGTTSSTLANALSATSSIAVSSAGVPSSLVITPSTAAVGAPARGTVTLSAAAPSGGAIVALVSASTSLATVPASVTIPAGTTTADFLITALPVTATSSVVITAMHNSVNATSSIQIAPSFTGVNNAQCVAHNIPSSMSTGQSMSASLTFKNTGTRVWTNGAPGGDHDLIANPYPPSNPGFSPGYVYTLPRVLVAPNETTTYAFTLTAPTSTGTYAANFQMLEQGVSYFGDLCGQASVTVSDVNVSSFAITPSTAATSSPARGTVTLNQAAPTGGTTVSLSSSDTSLATVPSSVTVAAGTTTAKFLVIGKTVSATSSATITASIGASSATSSVSVVPPFTGVNNAQCIANNMPTTMLAGATTSISLTFKNTGTTRWTNGVAGQPYPDYDTSLADYTQPWFPQWIQLTLPDALVLPGESTTFSFTMTATTTPGTYPGAYKMLEQNVEWFGETCGPANVTVNPPLGVSSLSTAPSTTASGSPARGTVTLNQVAPTGGTVVSLSSASTSLATVPSSVTVAAGTTTADFIITGQSVSATSSVVITATYSSSSATSSASVIPPFTGVNNAQCVAHNIPTTMTAGATANVLMTFKNTGTRVWTNGTPGRDDDLVANPYPPSNPGFSPGYIGTLPRILVAPNETTTYVFTLTAPASTGTYSANFQMLDQSVGYFGDICGQTSVTVSN